MINKDIFKAEIRPLLGLRFVPSDLSGHFQAMTDKQVPVAVFRAGVLRALTTRTDFPAPAELLQDCDQVKHLAQPARQEEDRGTDLDEPTVYEVPNHKPIRVTREWKYYCELCSDGGWASRWCGNTAPARSPWAKPRDCGKLTDHEPHEWVGKCVCYDSNPALIRKRENQGRFAVQERSR